MDRYQEVIAASKVTGNDEEVREEVRKIAEGASKYASKEVYEFLLHSIDLTTLSTDDSVKSVVAFTEKVNNFDSDYPQYPNVAAICVYSNFAEVVRNTLDVPGVDVAVVAGCFPSAQTFIEVKVADVAMAVLGGADEVDIVFPVGLYKDGDYEGLCDEIIEMKRAARGARLKVILETGLLKTAEDIRRASLLALYSEADFLKTSTGKIYPGASLEAAYVMCRCIKEYYENTGRKVGFKCSGGVRTTEEALAYYAVVKEVLGDEWLCHDLFRIGASSLANSVLSSLEGEEVKYF
ncbi:MAG: deoxyribose-phosphate aldolase [Muribaculaceae bacterium]|nr:deoxyribose-phosphate aldolase [Muribaculaceae bacterium]